MHETDRILAIDGDIILYSVGFGAQDITEEYLVHRRVDEFMARLFNALDTFQYEVYLTGKGNFREQLAVSHKYKGNRKAEKPKWYGEIKDYLIHEWDAVVVDGMEADDKLAMRITEDENVVCCTIDKDLLQVEGWHYSWGTHNKAASELHYVESFGFLEMRGKKLYGEGTMWLYAQAIMGDSTDNIVGVRGAGPKKAYTLLKDEETEMGLFETVLDLYEEHFDYPEERLEENMHLLYMVRGYKEDGSLVHWEKPE